jgi:rubrerythrin
MTAEGAPRLTVKLPLAKLQAALAQIERQMAEHYGWLAEVFTADPRARGFFSAMAEAERQHERLVHLECRLAKGCREAAVSVDVPDLRSTFADIGRFRSTTPSPTLRDALEFSLHLEDSAAEEHVGTALASVDPSLADFMRRLASDDHQHANALREFRDSQPLGG